MTSEYVQLVLFTPDPKQASNLKDRFRSCAEVVVAVGDGPDVTSRFHLDALWMTPTQASYYGILQSILPESAATFSMPKELLALGLPRLLVTGVTLIPGKSYTASFRAALPAASLARAIAEYNESHDDPILRVGSIPENLCLDSIEAPAAIREIQHVFAALPVHREQAVSQMIRQRA